MDTARDKNRKTAPRTRLVGVQIFRGLAALTVLFYHINLQFSAFVPGTPDFKASPWPWTIHRLGFLGVDFFFVLSGFIIHHIHSRDLGQPQQGRMFLLKRFFRIQPLLWLIILVKQLYLTFGNHEPVDWSSLLDTALTLPGYKIIGVAWTLTYEWMFYLFFLICIYTGKKHLFRLGAIWIAVIIAMSGKETGAWSPWLQLPASPFVVQFFCGVMAAEIFRLRPATSAGVGRIAAATAIILVLTGIAAEPFNLTPREWKLPLDMALGRYFWGLTFAIIVWWAAANDRLFRSGWLTPLVVIGNASYALYLFHNEMLQAFIRIGKAFGIFSHGSAILWMWIYTISILAACVAIHILIEAPMLKWSRRFISVKKPDSIHG